MTPSRTRNDNEQHDLSYNKYINNAIERPQNGHTMTPNRSLTKARAPRSKYKAPSNNELNQNMDMNNSISPMIQNKPELISMHNGVPSLDLRQSRSQNGMRADPVSMMGNPIIHGSDRNSKIQTKNNLWYHQREEKDEAKRKAKMFLDGLNEQRKQEKARKKIDQKFEAINEFKISQAKQERIDKEDIEREGFRRRFEQASKQNDVRVNHYLSNYYLPPEEKELRNNLTSERARSHGYE